MAASCSCWMGETGGASVRLTFPSEIVLADPALKSVQA